MGVLLLLLPGPSPNTCPNSFSLLGYFALLHHLKSKSAHMCGGVIICLHIGEPQGCLIPSSQNLKSSLENGFSTEIFIGRSDQFNPTHPPVLCLIYPGNICLVPAMDQSCARGWRVSGDYDVPSCTPRSKGTQYLNLVIKAHIAL